MSRCQKCNIRLGIMIEDEFGVLCIACHPTAIGTGLKQQEILQKLKDVDFRDVRERKYQ